MGEIVFCLVFATLHQLSNSYELSAARRRPAPPLRECYSRSGRQRCGWTELCELSPIGECRQYRRARRTRLASGAVVNAMAGHKRSALIERGGVPGGD